MALTMPLASKSTGSTRRACLAVAAGGIFYDLKRLPASFVKGRTVLLGDASHGMTPNLGPGAGQAIEDAVTLALLLGGPSPDVDAALGRYSTVRRARTKAIWSQSRLMGAVAQLSHPIAAGLRDTFVRVTPPRLLGRAAPAMHRWTAP